MRLLLSFMLMLSLSASAPWSVADHYGQIRIESVVTPLDLTNPSRQQVGALQFRGAWELRARDPAFGGVSSLRGTQHGFMAVGDAGMLLRFAMGPGGAIYQARLDQIAIGAGRSDEKRERDAESLVVDEAGGRYWVGFEFTNMIRRYDLATGKITAEVAPKLMKDWPPNAGTEAMIRLDDGRFLILSEDGGDVKHLSASLLFSGDPTAPSTTAVNFDYRPPTGYLVTDAAQLPDGRLLLLHRRFTMMDGVSAIVSMADPKTIRRGKIWTAQPIARLAPPLAVDNMEGIEVTQERGETLVWLVSDDNFSPLQRSLLMKFALKLKEPARAKGR